MTAVELHDGRDFSMVIPIDATATGGEPPRVCVVLPSAARNPQDCEGLTLDAVPEGAMATLAVIRSGQEELAWVAVKKAPDQGAAAFEPDSAPRVVQGFLPEARSELHAPLAIDESSVRSSTLVTAEGVRVVALQYEVSGTDPDGPSASSAHQGAVLVPVDGGYYVVTWLSSAASAKTADALAARATPTIHIAHPAHTRDYVRGRAMGEVLAGLVPTVAVVVGLVIYFMRRGRAATPPSHPIPGPYYPPGAPPPGA